MAQYIVGSTDPVPDVAFLWDDAVDTIVNRYKAEMSALFGTLERLGYEPYFISDEEILDGAYLDYSAIILPRNQKMFDRTFDLLLDINSAGVKIHADSDLPGIMDEYGQLRNRDDWLTTMRELFGIDAINSQVDPDLEDNIHYDGYETSSFTLRYMPKTLYYPDIGFYKTVSMWKYRDRILNEGGIVVATFDDEGGNPALVFHFDTAISLFSLGDNRPINNAPYEDWTWLDRYNWMKKIYAEDTGLGIIPRLMASNPYILVDYRICGDGSVMLSFKNYMTDSVEATTVITDLIVGKTIISLLTDELIDENCSGAILRTLEPDGHDLLLAYIEGDNPGDEDNPGDNDNPGAKDNPGDEDNPGDDDNPGDNDNPGDDDNPGDNDNPGDKDNPEGTGGNKSETDDTDSSGEGKSSTGTVIILGNNGNRRHKDESEERLEIPEIPDGETSSRVNRRTYTGGDVHHSDDEAYVAEETASSEVRAQRQPELPPFEQFDRAMEVNRYREMGQIKVTPKPTRKKLEEIIRPSREIRATESIEYPNNFIQLISNWVDKIKEAWKDLFNNLKLASKNIAGRYV